MRTRFRNALISPVPLVFLSSFLLTPLLPGWWWTSEPTAELLLREGHEAFAHGDYATAAERYEQAELRSTEPAQAAFYLAGAKYRLAVRSEGLSPELQEAEQWYRCCLNLDDSNRSVALFGLGNCLLHKAGSHDTASLRAALACYDECLRSAETDEALASDVRFNREKACLLHLQFVPPPRGSTPDRPPNDDLNPPLSQPDNPRALPMPAQVSGEKGDSDPRSDGKANPEKGGSATKSNEPPQPGKGNLEPIPDQVDAPPLSPHDADEHLTIAAKKVLQERRNRHRREDRPANANVKDW